MRWNEIIKTKVNTVYWTKKKLCLICKYKWLDMIEKQYVSYTIYFLQLDKVEMLKACLTTKQNFFNFYVINFRKCHIATSFEKVLANTLAHSIYFSSELKPLPAFWLIALVFRFIFFFELIICDTMLFPIFSAYRDSVYRFSFYIHFIFRID